MSAYLVNDDTLDLLASVADWRRDGLFLFKQDSTLPPRSEIETAPAGHSIYYGLSHAPDIKQELRLENIASLRARYSDADDMVSAHDKFKRIDSDQATIAEALGALSCYEYQACESETWFNSYAYAICQAIRRALCNMLSQGHWEYERPAGLIQRVSLMDLLD